MKLGESNIDELDRRILAEVQTDCKIPLAQVGKRVGLSAPSVMERLRKLEDAGFIRGYVALLDSRRVGLDVTAFIGVSVSSAGIATVEEQLPSFPEVLECHHVTGSYTLLLKAATANTASLERLISRLRFIEGVVRTETLIVLSTKLERTQVPLPEVASEAAPSRRAPRDAAAKDKASNQE
jgi:Lrp/AsnC family leucine-responsive transcriptional regulator